MSHRELVKFSVFFSYLAFFAGEFFRKCFFIVFIQTNLFESFFFKKNFMFVVIFDVKEFLPLNFFFHNGGWRKISWVCSFHTITLWTRLYALCMLHNSIVFLLYCRVCVVDAPWFMCSFSLLHEKWISFQLNSYQIWIYFRNFFCMGGI